jgi:hypothetical protein
MILCEKPLAHERRRGERRWWRPWRRPACPTWSGTTTAASRRSPWPSSSSTRASSAHLPLPRQVPAGLDHQRGPAAGRRGAVAAGRQGGRQRRHRRPAGPLHRHRAVAQRPHRVGHRDDRDLHQGAPAQPDRQGGEGRHRRRLRLPGALRQRLARRPSSPPATRAATRRSTPSRSTARTPRSSGICTTCTGCSTSTTATRAARAAGARST